MCRLNVRYEGSSAMKAVHLLCSLLDQHGYEFRISDINDKRVIIELKHHDDVIEIRSNLKVAVYCDVIGYVEDKPQLVVSLFHPRSLHFIAKYLRCIPKKEKRNDLL